MKLKRPANKRPAIPVMESVKMIKQQEASQTLTVRAKIFFVFVLALTFLLSLPALQDGLSRDDFYHRNYLLGQPTLPTELAVQPPGLLKAGNTLFTFFNEDKNHNLSAGKTLGWIPWWTSPQLKIDFWRPVAAASHWLDYSVWADRPAFMHLHSIFWYMALISCVFVFFRQVGLHSAALLTALSLYALDASHSEAVSWIANRNIIISATFGFAGVNCLLAYLSHKGGTLALVASLILLVLTLLGAEGGIAIVPFMLLAVLFNQHTSIQKKLLVICLVLVIFVGWQAAYMTGGHGASHSGVYLNPLSDGKAFLNNGLVQWPILFMDQVTGLETLQILLSDKTLGIQAIIAYVFCAVFIAFLLPLLRHSRNSRFLLLVAGAALVPAGTTILTGGRLMFFAGVAIAGLLGIFGEGVLRNAAWVPRHRGYRVVAKIFVTLLLLTQVGGNGFIWYSQAVTKLDKQEKVQISKYTDFSQFNYNDASTVIYVNPPVAFDMMYVPAKLTALGKAIPKEMVMLAPGIRSLSITRTSEKTLLMDCSESGCPFDATAEVGINNKPAAIANGMQRLDSFFSASDAAMLDSVVLPQMSAKIISRKANGLPESIEYRFSNELNSANYVWVFWDNASDRIVSWTPPPVGGTVAIAGFDR